MPLGYKITFNFVTSFEYVGRKHYFGSALYNSYCKLMLNNIAKPYSNKELAPINKYLDIIELTIFES